MAMTHHAAAECGCEDCSPHPLARNHYFTGKLMCERDFTDEQWFFREKIRLHHQRLHGVGVVCGLRIREYPNANCQDSLVILEPGSAVDCCGHDILVTAPDTFDFAAAPAVKALTDNKPHVLEFCLVWRECPTEEVPILYDECGCDDTQCAPNRILESYALEVRVDPPARAARNGTGKFHWGPSIGIAQAEAAALDETNQRIFIVAGPAAGPQTIYQVDTQHLLVEGSYAAAGVVQSIALAPAGATLYAALASATGPQLASFTPTAAGPGAAPATFALTGASATAVIALTTSAAGLFATDTQSGNYWFFPASAALAVPAGLTGSIGVACSPAAFSSNGDIAWIGTVDAATLNSITLASPATATPIPLGASPTASVTPGSVNDVALAANGAGADRLAILDKSGPYLHLFDTSAGSIIASVQLAVTPASLMVSADGGLAVVASAGALQAVNLKALAEGAADPAGAAFTLQTTLGACAMTAAGDRIYAPFTGAGAANQGGVAVVSLARADCRDALLGHDCPECEPPDCLVLARVAGWQAGSALQDMPHPSTPAPTGIAYIDNGARKVLASTEAITQALLCLMDHPAPGTSAPSPAPTPAPTTPTTPKLTHIVQISWPHGLSVQQSIYTQPTLALAFDGPVVEADLMQPLALMIQVSSYEFLENSKSAVLTWRQLRPTSLSFSFATPSPTGSFPSTWPASITTPLPPTTLTMCTAVQITLDPSTLAAAASTMKNVGVQDAAYLRVILNGDLVRDGATLPNGTPQPNGLDANHLPPWCGKPSYHTGDGVAGGVFESWLQFDEYSGFGRDPFRGDTKADEMPQPPAGNSVAQEPQPAQQAPSTS